MLLIGGHHREQRVAVEAAEHIRRQRATHGLGRAAVIAGDTPAFATVRGIPTTGAGA